MRLWFLGFVCGAIAAVLLPVTQASAQNRGDRREAPRGRPTGEVAQTRQSRELYIVNASPTDTPPRIDGILDDQVWQSAVMVDAFTQQEPRFGEPATERTEVRVLFDSRHLYIAVHAFDSNPSGIIATEMRRDSDRLLDEDSFQVIVDTFNDSRNGYMFVTNPLGAKLEQQIADEGEGNIRGNGVNSNINKDWDGIWESAAHITDDGWTAEMSILTTTVRFAKRPVQTWGINFMRNIRQKNEQVYWAPIPKSYALQHISMAGSLTGLTGLDQGMDLKLKPFMFSGVRDRRTSSTQSTSFLKDGGFDMKYGVTSGLNLDVTYRTDFAQVEVDEQQINLTRFSLQFPEKRDFFLENASLFLFGTGNVFTTTNLETDLFFSRKIGLSDTGQPVPIIGGVRLSGKQGPQTIGFLDIQTESAFGKPGNNFLIGRYSHDILRRSRVGAIFINKEDTGGSAHYNRSMGVDTTLALGRSLLVTAYLAKTVSPGKSGEDMAAFSRAQFRSSKYFWWLQRLDVQNNFNPEVGFVQRPGGVGVTKGYWTKTPRPAKWHIRSMELPGFMGQYLTDRNNRMTGRQARISAKATFDDDSNIVWLYEQQVDVVDAPFRISNSRVTIPVGRHDFDNQTLLFNTNPARRLYSRLDIRNTPEGYYEGKRRDFSETVGFRATNQLGTEINYQRTNVHLPYGDVKVNLVIGRVDYALSPRMTIRSLTQYNSSTHETTNSIRYNFIYRPGSDLYIVYNDLIQDSLPEYRFSPGARQFVIKFTYLLAQ